MSMPGPPHIEPPRWPGHTSHLVGECEQLLSERGEDLARAVLLLDREVGPCDVADEQRVAGEHGPRLGSTGGVDEREGRVLGAVPGRVERADPRRAPSSSSQPSANGSWSYCAPGAGVDVDRRAGRRGEPAVAGDVIGVGVGLEDVLDPDAHVARELQVLVDLELRVDDGGDPGLLVADQV